MNGARLALNCIKVYGPAISRSSKIWGGGPKAPSLTHVGGGAQMFLVGAYPLYAASSIARRPATARSPMMLEVHDGQLQSLEIHSGLASCSQGGFPPERDTMGSPT